MSRETFDIGELQELALLDKNGKEIDWYCPLTIVDDTGGDLYVKNDTNGYTIERADYHSYRIRPCDCRSVVEAQEAK